MAIASSASLDDVSGNPGLFDGFPDKKVTHSFIFGSDFQPLKGAPLTMRSSSHPAAVNAALRSVIFTIACPATLIGRKNATYFHRIGQAADSVLAVLRQVSIVATMSERAAATA